MAKLPQIQLSTQLKETLVQGHPWVYRNHVSPQMQFESGTWVRVNCGNWVGYGLWEADGAIAVRIFSDQQLPHAKWVKEQVELAWELRSPLRARGCTAYRWLFGEGDGVPGITVDLYGSVAVVQTYMRGATALLQWLVDALVATAPLTSIYLRGQAQDSPDSKISLICGDPVSAELIVKEYDLAFNVNLHAGQKTGLFLDHRDNRRWLQDWSCDRDVLNCFAYTGAFSLYALRGGASHVTSVDIGKGLANAAAANIALNSLPPERHTFVTQDCFDVLNRYVQDGRRFDLIILDPPSFAKTKQSRHAAQRAYTKLNALAMQCVTPNGFLATASCTSQVSPEGFKEAIAAAGALAKRRFQIIHEAGHAIDHPVPAHFPEGRYLKFVMGRITAARGA